MGDDEGMGNDPMGADTFAAEIEDRRVRDIKAWVAKNIDATDAHGVPVLSARSMVRRSKRFDRKRLSLYGRSGEHGEYNTALKAAQSVVIKYLQDRSLQGQKPLDPKTGLATRDLLWRLDRKMDVAEAEEFLALYSNVVDEQIKLLYAGNSNLLGMRFLKHDPNWALRPFIGTYLNNSTTTPDDNGTAGCAMHKLTALQSILVDCFPWMQHTSIEEFIIGHDRHAKLYLRAPFVDLSV